MKWVVHYSVNSENPVDRTGSFETQDDAAQFVKNMLASGYLVPLVQIVSTELRGDDIARWAKMRTA